MKRITLATVAGALLLAVGCAHKEKHASYQSTSSPNYTGSSTTYNQTYNSRTVDSGTVPNNSQYSYSYSPQVNSSVNQNTFQSQTEVSRGDSGLESQIRTALRNDTTLVNIAPSIQVTAQNGTVTLSGNVSNEQQKQTVEHLVKGTSGVVTVNNQLQVSPSATGGSSQSSIYSNSTSQVQGSLSSSSSPSALSGSSLTDLKGTDTNQSSTSSDASLSGTSDKSSSRLYSTKNDFSTNKSSSSLGGSGEASLGSTNSGSFSTQGQGGTSSSESFSTQGGASSTTNSSHNATSPDSSSSSTSTNQISFGAGASASVPSSTVPSTSDTSLGSTNTATSENKDLSATSERPSARVYSSTNRSDFSSGQTGNQGVSSSGSDSFSLRIRGTSDADQKLADQVHQELRTDSSLAASMSSVRISIENGKAVLRGSVKSDEDKQKIEKSIQKVTGVTSVENQLRVSGSGGASATGSTESK